MRTAVNVVVILLVALGLGLALRLMQPPSNHEAGEVAEGADDSGVLRPAPRAAADAANATGTSAEAAMAGESPEGEPAEGETWLTHFTLTERSGEEVASEDLRGQPYVVSFFFSTCPSVCVMQNQKIQQLQTEFAGQGVRFIAISVDPETDTPEQLTEYARRFKADEDQWLFLTGELNYIRRVAGEIYTLPADKKFHTEKLILVDPVGEIAGYYLWTEDRQFDQLKIDIRKMIDGGGEVG